MNPRPDQSKRARGRWGEDRACSLLERSGFIVLDRNWRSPEPHVRGELDVVASADDLLVFCEVKARRRATFGGAACAVDARKQEQIRHLAASWLRTHDVDHERIRFDVIAIDGVRVEHLDAAF